MAIESRAWVNLSLAFSTSSASCPKIPAISFQVEGSPLAFKGSGPGLWGHVRPAEQADLGEGAITASATTIGLQQRHVNDAKKDTRPEVEGALIRFSSERYLGYARAEWC